MGNTTRTREVERALRERYAEEDARRARGECPDCGKRGEEALGDPGTFFCNDCEAPYSQPLHGRVAERNRGEVV